MEVVVRPADASSGERRVRGSDKDSLKEIWSLIASGDENLALHFAEGGEEAWESIPLHRVVPFRRAFNMELTRSQLPWKMPEQYELLTVQVSALAEHMWGSSRRIQEVYEDISYLKLHILWVVGDQVDTIRSDLEQVRLQNTNPTHFRRNQFYYVLPQSPQDAYFDQLVTQAAANDKMAALCVAISMPLLEDGMVRLYSILDEEEKKTAANVEAQWQAEYKAKLDVVKGTAELISSSIVKGEMRAEAAGFGGGMQLEFDTALLEKKFINWHGVKLLREVFKHYKEKPAHSMFVGINLLNADEVRRLPHLIFVHNSALESVEIYEVTSGKAVGAIIKRTAIPNITYEQLQRVGHNSIYVANYRIAGGKLLGHREFGISSSFQQLHSDGFRLPKAKKHFWGGYTESVAASEYVEISPRATQVTHDMSEALKECGIVGGGWKTVTEGVQHVSDVVEEVPSDSAAWNDGFREVDGATVVAGLGGWFEHSCEKVAWWQKVNMHVPGAGNKQLKMAFGHCLSQSYAEIATKQPNEVSRVTVFAAEGALVWGVNVLLG